MATQFPIGSMVWAKCGKKDPYWPGFIVSPEYCGLEEKEGQLCVFWLLDNRVSMVSTKSIQDYWDHFKVHQTQAKGTKLLSSINESMALYLERAFKMNVEHLDYMGRKHIMYTIDSQRKKYDDYTLPDNICCILRKIKKITTDDQTPDIPESDNLNGIEKFYNSLKCKKIKDPEAICIFCHTSVELMEERHPFVQSGLCFKCKTSFSKTVFVFKAKPKQKVFCSVCGQGASNWSSEDFMMAFCNTCQKNVCGNKFLRKDKSFKKHCLTTLFWPKPLEEECRRIRNPALEHFTDSAELNVLHLSLVETKENDVKRNTVVNCNFLGMKKKIKLHVEYKTFSDMKNEAVSLEKYKLIIGKPHKTGDVWSKESEEHLYLKNIYVEFFMEFYKIISPKKTEKLWFYEMPAAIKGEFCATITRFMNVWPYVIQPSELSSSHCPFEYHRLVWTNTSLDICDICNLISCTQI